MKLKFIQYTSPQDKPGGYQWVERSGIGEPLETLNRYLRQIDWLQYEENSRCGILLLPDNNVGIAFKIIKGLSAHDGRTAKYTTNGAAFSLTEAKNEGINGIWTLPFLDDPAEKNRETEILFFSSHNANDCSNIDNAIDQEEETLFWISQNYNDTWKIEKLFPKGQQISNTGVNEGNKYVDVEQILHLLKIDEIMFFFSNSNCITLPRRRYYRHIIWAIIVGVVIGKILLDF